MPTKVKTKQELADELDAKTEARNNKGRDPKVPKIKVTSTVSSSFKRATEPEED
jgi:hypothetical protein